jgi:hypothetical protein
MLLRITTAATLWLICAQPGLTQTPPVVATSYIPNARCMRLNLSHDQMLERRVLVPMRAAPRNDAEIIGEPPSTVIVREGSDTQGFVEVMLANGRTGWVAKNDLKPWQPLPGTQRVCRPAILSNGRIGYDVTPAPPAR